MSATVEETLEKLHELGQSHADRWEARQLARQLRGLAIDLDANGADVIAVDEMHERARVLRLGCQRAAEVVDLAPKSATGVAAAAAALETAAAMGEGARSWHQTAEVCQRLESLEAELKRGIELLPKRRHPDSGAP